MSQPAYIFDRRSKFMRKAIRYKNARKELAAAEWDFFPIGQTVVATFHSGGVRHELQGTVVAYGGDLCEVVINVPGFEFPKWKAVWGHPTWASFSYASVKLPEEIEASAAVAATGKQ